MTTLAVPSRRRFLLGAVALAAAPAIVRVASLMPLSAPKPNLAALLDAKSEAFVVAWEKELWGQSSHLERNGLAALIRDTPRRQPLRGVDRSPVTWWRRAA